jgi:hypothetical protein
MTIVPRSWSQIAPGTIIIDPTGRQRESTLSDYPPEMAGAALVCVFTDAELLAQALSCLLPAFPGLTIIDQS